MLIWHDTQRLLGTLSVTESLLPIPQLPQMPSKYDPQLGELIKRMLCKRPEDRPDVKHILRQPYIKQQIAVFLEATKE